MATLISFVRNETSEIMELRLPGYNPVKIVTIAASATADLLSEMSMDTLEALQPQLVSMIAAGALSSQGTTGSGVVIGHNDNLASLRMRGPDFSGTVVQSYAGIYYNNDYDTTGILKTRTIYGANDTQDLEIQGPRQLRITAADPTFPDGQVRIASITDCEIHARAIGDVQDPNYLIVDRVDIANIGSDNFSDVVVKAQHANLRLNYGVVDGAVVLPSLTETQRNALTPVEGMVIWDSTNHKLDVYNGSAWRAVDDSAV